MVAAALRSTNRGRVLAWTLTLLPIVSACLLDTTETQIQDLRTSSDEVVRVEAAHKLATSPHPQVLPALISALQDPSPRVRSAVARALAINQQATADSDARFNVLASLDNLLRDPSGLVRYDAENALDALRRAQKGPPALVDWAGRDPHSFADAAAMYREEVEEKAFDRVAARAMEKLDGLLAKQPVESAEVREVTAALMPYRRTQQVQGAMKGWVSRIIARLPTADGSKVVSTREALRAAEQKYLDGDLVAAERAFAEILAAFPRHFDARNNFGLCELHRGNDVLAQLEMETLTTLDRSYLPARVNATVIYERLGGSHRTRAAESAHEAAALGQDSVAALFNDAWYDNLDGRFDRAKAGLDALAPLSDKFASFQRVNELQRVRAKAEVPSSKTEDAHELKSELGRFRAPDAARDAGAPP